MRNLFLIAMLCGALAAAADETIMFKPAMCKTKCKVESFMDEDGMNAVRLSKTLNSTAKGNEYIDVEVKLPQEVDLTGKALVVRVQTDTPEVLRGFYVRAYNAGEKKPALSFNMWKPKDLLAETYIDITVTPGKNGLLNWEPKAVSGTEPTKVDRLSFHAGSPERGKEMALKIKSVRIIESPAIAMDKFFAGIGKLEDRIPTSFGEKTQALFADGVMTLSGRSPKTASRPGANLYQGASFKFAAPVNCAGKKLRFEYRVVGPVSLLFFRGTEPTKDNKGCWSWSTFRTKKEWTALELPLDPGTSVKDFKHEKQYDGDLAKFQVFSVIFSTQKLDTDIAVELRNVSFAD